MVIENNLQNMNTFSFNRFGNELGTRMLGMQVREELLPLINSVSDGDKLVLDFDKVAIVANSFADECLAKLLLVMPLEELKKRTTFRNTNDFVRRTIAVAFKRRQSSIEHPEDWPSLAAV